MAKLWPADLGNKLLAAFTPLNTFDDASISRLGYSQVCSINNKLTAGSDDYTTAFEYGIHNLFDKDERKDVQKEVGDNERKKNEESDVLPMLEINQENLVSLDAAFRGAVSAYLSSLRSNVDGRTILKDIQHISEVLGFYIRIRDSRYTNQHKGTEKETCTVLCRARFECQVKKHGDLKCTFDLKISAISFPRSTEIDDDGTVNKRCDEESTWMYDAKMSRACHSHGPVDIPWKKYVPTKMKQDASHMYSTPHMKLDDVLRYLEDEYCIKVNKDLFKRQVKYMTTSSNPKEKECYNLCVNLMKISQENPLNKTFFSITADTAMNYAAWAFSEWIED